MTPTKIYVKALLPLIKEQLVAGVAHITGGGFVENIPRMLPENLSAEMEKGTWPVLPIFHALKNTVNCQKRKCMKFLIWVSEWF